MNNFGLTIVIAVTIEALIEYTKTIINAFSNKEFKTAITQIAAIIISMILCVATGADIYSSTGMSFSHPEIGFILTGIFASRGANYASDFIKKLCSTKTE